MTTIVTMPRIIFIEVDSPEKPEEKIELKLIIGTGDVFRMGVRSPSPCYRWNQELLCFDEVDPDGVGIGPAPEPINTRLLEQFTFAWSFYHNYDTRIPRA
jgi:hypothetical protein